MVSKLQLRVDAAQQGERNIDHDHDGDHGQRQAKPGGEHRGAERQTPGRRPRARVRTYPAG